MIDRYRLSPYSENPWKGDVVASLTEEDLWIISVALSCATSEGQISKEQENTLLTKLGIAPDIYGYIIS